MPADDVSGVDRPRTPSFAAAIPERWRLLVVGYCACVLVGFGYARWMVHGHDWNAGQPWERELLLWVRANPLPQLAEWIMHALPWTATNITLVPIAIGVSWWLVARHRRHDLAVWIMTVTMGCYTLNLMLKQLVDRARPDLWERVGWYQMPAYPSGHVMAAIATLGTYAIIVQLERRSRWPVRVAIIVGLIISYSRLYHGVHWPTDLIGGAAIGVVWLLVTARVFLRHRRERASGEGRAPAGRDGGGAATGARRRP